MRQHTFVTDPCNLVSIKNNERTCCLSFWARWTRSRFYLYNSFWWNTRGWDHITFNKALIEPGFSFPLFLKFTNPERHSATRNCHMFTYKLRLSNKGLLRPICCIHTVEIRWAANSFSVSLYQKYQSQFNILNRVVWAGFRTSQV